MSKKNKDFGSSFGFMFIKDEFPPKWNVSPFKVYTAIVRKYSKTGMSVVFFDDGDQIIDTIFSYKDFTGTDARLSRVNTLQNVLRKMRK